jgi:hypothetical protein
MKLSELKQKVYESWILLNSFQGQLLATEQFKPEIRRFGDLRRKDTWIGALATFEAIKADRSCLDASILILYSFNFKRDRWDYPSAISMVMERAANCDLLIFT